MDAQDSDDEAAMAQTMGFSSFGGPKKSHLKRRYDEFSFVSTTTAAAAAVQRTGANAVTLQEKNPAGKVPLADDDDDAAAPTIPAAETSDPSRSPAPPNLPARPAPGTGFVGSFANRAAAAQRSGHHHGGNQSSHNTFNPLWYEGYYDPSSNQNPWHRLETSMGLKPLGPWPSRD